MSTARIVEGLEHLAVPTADLKLLPGNPRRGDVEAIARILDRFGQRKPITVRPDGTVTAGNHTLLAARSLEWETIAAIRIEEDDAEALAWSAADNRTAELGTYDADELVALLSEIHEADAELLAVAGYAMEDLDDLRAAIEESAPVDIAHTDPHSRYGGGEAEGSFTEPTIGDRYDDYQSKGVRSVVLDYPLDEYERVAKLAAELREAWGVASTAELFKELLERASA